MAGGSNGYRAALVSRQLTPGLISSLPRTAGLPPFISFSTSYPELDSAVRRAPNTVPGDAAPVPILVARALGLDCGPMSGFDADKQNAAFFPDGNWKVNLLCNLGYGDPNKLHPRNPRQILRKQL
jgi:hypothetical protein